ncbi:MAG: Fe-S cluster assembly protein SufD [Pseudobdellovibrio sp.]
MNWESSYLQFKSRSALDSLKANELRQNAFTRFMEQGLPSKKEEAWKFTSLTGFKDGSWSLPEESESLLSHDQLQEISKHLPSEFINFVFVNGYLNQTLSDDSNSLLELQELTEGDFEFNQAQVENKLLNFAQAFLTKKISVKVNKGRVIEKPVQILFVQVAKTPSFTSEKLQIHMEDGSDAKVIVKSMNLALGAPSALNLNIQVKSEYNSNLKLIQLQNENSDSYHFSQCHIAIAPSAYLTSLAVSLGNKLVRNYYELDFTGHSANAQVYGLSVLDGEQHVDNYTFIKHSIGGNDSLQHYKSILSGSSHSVFRGRVRIEQDAQKANSSQLNNNLLLTRSAQADSIPQLEIYADDVKAGHGSTVGQLNKEEIFYFLSRGINQFEAVKMLSQGYATELVYKFENPLLRNFLIQSISQKLEKLAQNG